MAAWEEEVSEGAQVPEVAVTEVAMVAGRRRWRRRW